MRVLANLNLRTVSVRQFVCIRLWTCPAILIIADTLAPLQGRGGVGEVAIFLCVAFYCVDLDVRSRNSACDIITGGRYLLGVLLTLEIRRLETLLADALTFLHCRTDAGLVQEIVIRVVLMVCSRR